MVVDEYTSGFSPIPMHNSDTSYKKTNMIETLNDTEMMNSLPIP